MADPLSSFRPFPRPWLAFGACRGNGAEFGREVIWRPHLLGVAFKSTGNRR